MIGATPGAVKWKPYGELNFSALEWTVGAGSKRLQAAAGMIYLSAYESFPLISENVPTDHLSLMDSTSLFLYEFACAEAWGWAAATGVLWGLSYFFWRHLQATPASA